MPVSDGFIIYAIDQLSGGRPIEHKRMFGAIGLYSDGLFFGLINDDTLYFKVDDSNRIDFEERSMGPFRPYGDERSMSYFQVPADVLEDPERLAAWSAKALAVSRAAKKTAKKKKKKK